MRLDPKIRAEVLAQIKKRAAIQFDWPTDDPKNDDKAERLYRLAVERARYHHRHHDRENLPVHDDPRPIDAEMQAELAWQEKGTLLLIQNEHLMTLEAYFTAVGVEGPTARAVVEYLIAKDKAASED